MNSPGAPPRQWSTKAAVSRTVRERGGYPLMPELNYNPTNQYLPPRKKDRPDQASLLAPLLDIRATGFAGWLDKMLGKI